VILKYIEMQGFGSYEHLTRWDVPMGITGIVGVYDENIKKSNGSGKSTMISAITYALYGEGECTKLDELVNDRVKENKGHMFCKVGFEINNKHYQVVRGIKGGSYLDFFIISDNGDRTRVGDESTTIAMTQSNIFKTLKMEYDMFSASGFFEQNKLDKFINADAAVRRSYTDKVFALEDWRGASKKSISNVSQLKLDISNLLKTIQEQEIREKELGLKSNQLDIKAKEIENFTSQKKEKEKGFSKYEQVYPLISRLTFNQETLDINNFNINKHNKDLLVKKEELISLSNKANDDNTQQEVISLKSLLDSQNKYKIDKQKEVDLKDKINTDLNKKLAVILSSITEINTRINMESNKSLSEDTKDCPVCRQEITAEHIQYENDKIDQQIKNLQESLKSPSSEKEEIQKSIKDNLSEKESINNKIKLVDLEITELTKKIHKSEIDKLSLSKDIQSLNQDINNTELLISETLKSNKSIEIEIKEAQEKIQEVFPDGKLINLDTLKQELNDINSKVLKLTEELAELKIAKQEYSELKNKIEKNKIDLISFQEDLYFTELASSLFKDIPTKIFKDSIADVESAANDLIQRIIPTLQVKFWEDLDKKTRKLMISFISNGFARSYDRLSGGEKTIVNIGVRLGYSQVITARAETSIDFIVLDEPFGALDEENRELVKKIFAIMSQWFTQILVISHDDSIENFPNILKIGKTEEGVSYII